MDVFNNDAFIDAIYFIVIGLSLYILGKTIIEKLFSSAKENISRVLNQSNPKANAPSSIDNSNKTIWYFSILIIWIGMPWTSDRIIHFFISGLVTYFIIKDDFPNGIIPKNNQFGGWAAFIAVIIFGSWLSDLDWAFQEISFPLFYLLKHRSPLTHSIILCFVVLKLMNKIDWGNKDWNLSLFKIFCYSLAGHLFLDMFDRGANIVWVPEIFEFPFYIVNGIACILFAKNLNNKL